MPKATGIVDECQKTYSELERELDATLDSFVSASENGEEFFKMMEKVESQLAHASRMQDASSDLDLNEAVVLADRLEEELGAAQSLAVSAVLSETEGEWADELERAKNSLDRLSLHMKKIKSDAKGGKEGSALEARSAIRSFKREAKGCAEKLAKLKSRMAGRKHPIYSHVESVKRKVSLLRSTVAKKFTSLSKTRLRGRIAEAKEHIISFMKNYAHGRIFVDHKHLTLSSGTHKNRVPLTESVRYALEEIAPIEKSLLKLGRGACVTGSFETDASGTLLRIGERTVAGDSIIYREASYRL
ncbi:Uncharacterised protein [uncultured archaeon]|nr:Uncharacterised protein [uncultured archaeon]